jgi:hypothetical protein
VDARRREWGEATDEAVPEPALTTPAPTRA